MTARRFPIWLAGGFGLALLTPPSAAVASPNFQNEVPNGLAVGCVACHVQNGDPNRNVFGNFVAANLVSGLPNWAALWDTDSDGDGQTNGEELGDPCGTWRRGRPAPRTTNISNPGRSNSTSATPDEPPCAPPDAGVPDFGRVDLGPNDTGAVDLGLADGGQDAGRDTGFFFPRDTGVVDAGSEVDEGGCRCVAPRQRAMDVSLFLSLVALALFVRARRDC